MSLQKPFSRSSEMNVFSSYKSKESSVCFFFQSEEFRRVAIFVLHCITGTSQGIGIPNFTRSVHVKFYVPAWKQGFGYSLLQVFCSENGETI